MADFGPIFDRFHSPMQRSIFFLLSFRTESWSKPANLKHSVIRICLTIFAMALKGSADFGSKKITLMFAGGKSGSLKILTHTSPAVFGTLPLVDSFFDFNMCENDRAETPFSQPVVVVCFV